MFLFYVNPFLGNLTSLADLWFKYCIEEQKLENNKEVTNELGMKNFNPRIAKMWPFQKASVWKTNQSPGFVPFVVS
jgi:hypothetical protein